MNTVDFSNKNFSEYEAKQFFADYGMAKVDFTKKVIETSDGAKVALLTVTGVVPQNGQRISLDLWPSRCQTLEDIKNMPEHPLNIVIRFGRFTDEETGEVTEAGAPRVWCYIDKDGHDVLFHGAKPEWNGSRSVYTNEPAEKPAEREDEE